MVVHDCILELLLRLASLEPGAQPSSIGFRILRYGGGHPTLGGVTLLAGGGLRDDEYDFESMQQVMQRAWDNRHAILPPPALRGSDHHSHLMLTSVPCSHSPQACTEDLRSAHTNLTLVPAACCRWALGIFGFRFPFFLTTSHMLFGFLALLPWHLRHDWEGHKSVLLRQWKGLVAIGAFLATGISLNNISLVYITLSLNQVIRCVGWAALVGQRSQGSTGMEAARDHDPQRSCLPAETRGLSLP